MSVLLQEAMLNPIFPERYVAISLIEVNQTIKGFNGITRFVTISFKSRKLKSREFKLIVVYSVHGSWYFLVFVLHILLVF